jgi:hypothetical protein
MMMHQRRQGGPGAAEKLLPEISSIEFWVVAMTRKSRNLETKLESESVTVTRLLRRAAAAVAVDVLSKLN